MKVIVGYDNNGKTIWEDLGSARVRLRDGGETQARRSRRNIAVGNVVDKMMEMSWKQRNTYLKTMRQRNKK